MSLKYKLIKIIIQFTILAIGTVHIIAAIPIFRCNKSISVDISRTASTTDEKAPTVHRIAGSTQAFPTACLTDKIWHVPSNFIGKFQQYAISWTPFSVHKKVNTEA